MRELLEACPNAKFIMSQALLSDEFQVYAAAYKTPLTAKVRAGVREFRETHEMLRTSGRTTLTFAGPDRCVFAPGAIAASHGAPIQLWTLSPADAEYDNFLAWIAEQTPTIGETRRVSVARLRNDLSVVVLVGVGTDAILLGGDLEEEGKADTGWSAILASAGRPQMPASVHKVAHHGSQNGDHPGIWNSLLTSEPMAILAPFKNGNVILPTPTDSARILGYTPNAFAAAPAVPRRTRRRPQSVEKTIKEAARSFGTVLQVPGMVRLRKKIGTETVWRTERMGDARHLADVHKYQAA
jgi:hypothetical protein